MAMDNLSLAGYTGTVRLFCWLKAVRLCRNYDQEVNLGRASLGSVVLCQWWEDHAQGTRQNHPQTTGFGCGLPVRNVSNSHMLGAGEPIRVKKGETCALPPVECECKRRMVRSLVAGTSLFGSSPWMANPVPKSLARLRCFSLAVAETGRCNRRDEHTGSVGWLGSDDCSRGARKGSAW